MNRALTGLTVGVLLLGPACGTPEPPQTIPVIPPTVTMTVQERPLAPGEYSRGQLFGYDYIDADHDRCNTREEMLAAPGPCPPKATTASIIDPYTGQRVTGRANIEVEHIVSLHWYWEHVGTSRPKSERVEFANDYGSPDGVDNVILASASENSRKGDRGPSEYLPPDPGRRCWYAARWQAILVEYHIVLPPGDPDAVALANVLRTC